MAYKHISGRQPDHQRLTLPDPDFFNTARTGPGRAATRRRMLTGRTNRISLPAQALSWQVLLLINLIYSWMDSPPDNKYLL
jgi:hypothetical protein